MMHICQNNIFHNGHYQTSNQVISEIIKQKFVYVKCIYTPKDIISDMKNDHRTNSSYKQAYQSKKKAL